MTVPENYRIIETFVEPGSNVLDLGCGNGDLLAYLVDRRKIKPTGIEISMAGVLSCVSKGLMVYQGDIDEGLKDYSDNYFDFVCLNSTLEYVHNASLVLKEMVRVGRKAIISITNYSSLSGRLRFLFRGKLFGNQLLNGNSGDSPIFSIISFEDFKEFCNLNGYKIEGEIHTKSLPGFLLTLYPTLLSEQAIFLFSKESS
ncbi:MAG: methyltransferase domain-containing protein [Candidatus Tectomicrobia bacterium]|uniref:Methyltransferase domain-containing protein n=1 Tax=Tectimicrobiota bacterium TaxID=2528274 RepID=A0A933LQN8_UNCTE|nr:methyltransferase domain-containing protein [Candidatus Tectomicrobia bacterium]